MISNKQLFLEHLGQTSDFPLMLEIEKAEGIYMYGSGGEKYIDLISGIGVSNVGHCHPNVVKAIQHQAEKFMHLMVYGEYVQSPQVKLAEAIAKTLPSPLSSSYFVNSGSEAVEGALKLAKRYTGRRKLVSFNNAYHGSTHGALSVTGNEGLKQAYRPLLPEVYQLTFNDISALESIDSSVAAVIIESVQGEAGVRLGDPSFFQALRKRCSEVGALLICDEIQTGFGRTGKFWGFEHHDIIPDIIVSAKGMGGGMPIGAFISSKEIMSVLKTTPILGHITTFGGHPVSCAASLACLNTIIDHKLIDSVEQKAELIRLRLKHSLIKEIRGKGLMLAVEFESFEVVKPIIDKAIELGVVTDWFLFCDNSMRIAPPLIITEEEINHACDIILKAIAEA